MILVRLALQTLVLALRQIWSNRVRAALTTLGIVIGVASVIAIVGGTQGLQKFVLKEFEAFGATRFVVFPRFPRDAANRFSSQQVQLKKREADEIRRVAGSLLRMTPVKGFSAAVGFGDREERNVRVTGMLEDWHLIEGRAITFGRPFSRIDMDERLAVCIVNDRAIEELGLNTDPTGQSVLIDGRKFLIVGVVETKSLPSAFGGGEPLTEVFIPFSMADAMKPEPIFGIFIQGTMRDAKDFAELREEIRSTLRRMRGLTPEDPDTFAVYAVEEFINRIRVVSFGLTLAATAIVAISLVVGGVGIMNIMLASVSERTREIGLRKAVGASPLVILTQFLIEATTLCLIGAAVGLAIGFALVEAAAAVPDSPLSEAFVPAWAVGLAVGFSAATGIVFGMFPAIKAARLNPIDALRHE